MSTDVKAVSVQLQGHSTSTPTSTSKGGTHSSRQRGGFKEASYELSETHHAEGRLQTPHMVHSHSVYTPCTSHAGCNAESVHHVWHRSPLLGLPQSRGLPPSPWVDPPYGLLPVPAQAHTGALPTPCTSHAVHC